MVAENVSPGRPGPLMGGQVIKASTVWVTPGCKGEGVVGGR